MYNVFHHFSHPCPGTGKRAILGFSLLAEAGLESIAPILLLHLLFRSLPLDCAPESATLCDKSVQFDRTSATAESTSVVLNNTSYTIETDNSTSTPKGVHNVSGGRQKLDRGISYERVLKLHI